MASIEDLFQSVDIPGDPWGNVLNKAGIGTSLGAAGSAGIGGLGVGSLIGSTMSDKDIKKLNPKANSALLKFLTRLKGGGMSAGMAAIPLAILGGAVGSLGGAGKGIYDEVTR